MSLKIFCAICILGCDFMLYALFQWLYGEKHRKHVRKLPAKNPAARLHERRPYLVKPEKREVISEEKARTDFAGNKTLHAPAA